MKPVFFRSNQHPVVVESFDSYLRIYRMLRVVWGKDRDSCRKYIIKLADRSAYLAGPSSEWSN